MLYNNNNNNMLYNIKHGQIMLYYNGNIIIIMVLT